MSSPWVGPTVGCTRHTASSPTLSESSDRRNSSTCTVQRVAALEGHDVLALGEGGADL